MAAQPNPDWGMTGKVAIVTGGGAAGDGIGNGRAAAILLAGAGARVLVVDRDVALAERTVAMIAEDGGEAAAVALLERAEEAGAERTSYSTSKGAVIALSRAMAVDHGPDGIRVNCVAPGPVYTPMVQGDGMSAEARARRRQASVLGLEGTGWDVGQAVRFLLSDQARYITGHTLVVDGGATLVSRARSSDDQPADT